MTKAQTIWIAVLVLAASCLVAAEEPGVWHLAQQAPDSRTGQSSSDQTGQPQDQTGQTGQPQDQSGQQPAGQAVAPGSPPGAPPAFSGEGTDPRVDQPLEPMQPLPPVEPAAQTATPGPGAAPMLPDTTPLNGPTDLTLGTGGGLSGLSGLNAITPSARFSTAVFHSSGVVGLGTDTSGDVSGSVNVLHNWARSGLNLNYTLGGSFYSESSLNSWYQTLGLGMHYNLARWTLALNDFANYLPGIAYGFYGTQFLNGGTNIGTGYVPNQSILALDTSEISNTVTGEATYKLSGRSSIHFSGSWGVLRYQGGGLINSDNLIFGAGYDHTIGTANTIGISYSASQFSYGGSSANNFLTHGINLNYGRRITGKLALQLSGGAQLGAYGSGGLSWNMRTGLVYQLKRMSLSSSIWHFASGGAGVYYGADTWEWDSSAMFRISRQWNPGFSMGVARNSALQTGALPNTTFNSQYVSVMLTRLLTPTLSMFVNYNFQHQSSPFPVCPTCSTSYEGHRLGVGFGWQGRPITGWF